MTTYTYAQVPCQATRTGACPACGKKVKRQRTFTQTINPFNRLTLPDGSVRPKTPQEVFESVRAEAAAWAPDPEVFRHNTVACAAPAPVPADGALADEEVNR